MSTGNAVVRRRLFAIPATAVTAIAVLLAACGSSSAGTTRPLANRSGTSGSPAAPSSALFGPAFYGVNYDYVGAALFHSASVDQLLARLTPGTLRWPGGTEADYFDWRVGKPTQKSRAFVFKLDRLARAYQATGATPIFDLNVLAPGNQTDPADQIDMLRSARRMGLPIEYVEIGNELYGGGAFQKAFPDGSAYGKTVAIYVRALHAAFPGVHVAADASLNPRNARQRRWNKQLLATATGTGAPDALILHDYPGAVYDPFTPNDLPSLFASAYAAISQLDQVAGTLPAKPIWLTEYNFRGPYTPRNKRHPNPVTTSYAHELYLAAFALMLPRVTHLALADNWAAFNGPAFGAWTNPSGPELTPGGQAVAMIDRAAYGASSSRPITIHRAPTLPGGAAAVTGQAFTGAGRATTALLVNLTGTTQRVPVSANVPAGARYQQATGQPTAQLTAAGPLAMGRIHGDNVTLPAYSITLINASISGQ